ncbi:MAG: polymer-forming cytoskeletal protein [Ignavibacteriae bacterium]|nr:polymer-forming cytoskeletal protein [Ignavibacteriota bacterium]
MFGKKEQEKPMEVSAPSRTAGNSSQIRTLISEGCKFEGNLFSPGSTRIDGIVKGNLAGESGLIIGDKGTIEGDIHSIEVTIYGYVKGNVKADKLEVKKGGKIYGDISINQLAMEPGAVFIGHCKMNEPTASKNEAFDLPKEQKKEEVKVQAK